MSNEKHPETDMIPESQTIPEVSEAEIEAIIKKYDAESNFRDLTGITAAIAKVACICLSLFHVYTAGFGLLNEVAHRTVHLSFVLGLVFLIFPQAPQLWTDIRLDLRPGVFHPLSLSHLAAYPAH